MSTHDGPWPNGTPCWTDLTVADPDAAATFYTALLGWEVASPDESMGGYRICSVGGRMVAGLAPTMPGAEAAPSAWSLYLASDDADKTAEKVKEAGGQLITDPDEIASLGRMFFAADSAGAAFGVWEARDHSGIQLVNEPGALTWEECWTRDFEGAQRFYSDVFGFAYDDMSAEGFTYAVIRIGDRQVGGVAHLGPQMPADIPAHWGVYFSVPDTDAAVGTVTGSGGTVVRAAEDTPYGRMAVALGPHGEQFSLIDSDDRQQLPDGSGAT
jgi:predicted enzyme related to lactoylglutathione lyase